MSYLTEGIKKLRAVYVTQAKEAATSTVRLWRGMRNLDVGDKFLADRRGGTEARSLSLRARVGAVERVGPNRCSCLPPSGGSDVDDQRHARCGQLRAE